MIQSRLEVLPERIVKDGLVLLLAFEGGAERDSLLILLLEVFNLLDHGPVWVHLDSNIVIVYLVCNMVPLRGKVDRIAELCEAL